VNPIQEMTNMSTKTPALIAENIHKNFGELKVLQGISLTAYQGDVFAMLGSSGSGKSTFAYFIEFCLGGYIKYFDATNENHRYLEIVNDENNFCGFCVNHILKLKQIFQKG